MDNIIHLLSEIDQIYLWDLIGTFVFGISGVLVGLERKMDVFGMFILAFVTGVGGGTVRDVLIRTTTVEPVPVFWMKNLMYVLMIVASVVITLPFKKKFVGHWSYWLMVFDTIGLGVFTIIGLEKTLRFELSPVIAILLGAMTGSFGGVIRDILANKLPAVFHKEIYATACVAGGIVYFLIDGLMGHNTVVFITILVVIAVRLLSVKYKWELPKFLN
nr:trimeric intracellular cation channel family protein [uncultured Capnocytophaga sp.]